MRRKKNIVWKSNKRMGDVVINVHNKSISLLF